MRLIALHPRPQNVWRRLRRYLEHVRDWPANGSNLYSPLFCLLLLVAVGLIIGIGR